jgi:uncharacterized protein YbaP (TraB family)
MNMKFLRRLIAAPFILLAPPSVAQTAATPPPIVTPDPDQAKPALWMVRDADTTIYLFGTIHVLKPGTRWFGDRVKTAFDTSDELVLEMVQPDAKTMQNIVISNAGLKGGVKLPDRLPDRDQVRYMNVMSNFGMPLNTFDRAQPWYVATNLSILPLFKLGYSPAVAPEAVLTEAANAAKKPIVGLETAEQQIGFLANLSGPVQLTFLESTLREQSSVEKTMASMVDAWSTGDPDKLGILLNSDVGDSPELAKTLLFDRNARWAQWIKARLARPGTVFIAVGAGHLAGQQSVIDQLKALNLTATRVPY